ncbi:MAG: hypothetical protein UY41_C0023G0010 [Candidatus Moranbacteria bacterium GW2011_GWE1_49_15]|nr:MAG: hypothetical protein UX75_C0039G0020 [Candidatus Moranbacteria bacterium GW2011_GWE2_47_10]KKW06495.1 MAG: hypothetical protein UY41_C0023G0010 [Candidatus Moranbacteria bacterium GW2011_GWE1_49_15]HBP01106.1 hypothetical protein [Candidatus Moranbacteria bacterium]
MCHILDDSVAKFKETASIHISLRIRYIQDILLRVKAVEIKGVRIFGTEELRIKNDELVTPEGSISMEQISEGLLVDYSGPTLVIPLRWRHLRKPK